MIRSLWTSATGMQAQELNIDVIANNLANVNTSGFKKSRAEFQDLLYESMRPAGAASSADTTIPTGIQLGHGTRPSAVQKMFSQGDFQNTQSELDWAIEGDGFFQIELPNGDTSYSRCGEFKLDADGRIVNADGLPAGAANNDSNRHGFNYRGDGWNGVRHPGRRLRPQRDRHDSAGSVCKLRRPEKPGKKPFRSHRGIRR